MSIITFIITSLYVAAAITLTSLQLLVHYIIGVFLYALIFLASIWCFIKATMLLIFVYKRRKKIIQETKNQYKRFKTLIKNNINIKKQKKHQIIALLEG